MDYNSKFYFKKWSLFRITGVDLLISSHGLLLLWSSILPLEKIYKCLVQAPIF